MAKAQKKAQKPGFYKDSTAPVTIGGKTYLASKADAAIIKKKQKADHKKAILRP